MKSNFLFLLIVACAFTSFPLKSEQNNYPDMERLYGNNAWAARVGPHTAYRIWCHIGEAQIPTENLDKIWEPGVESGLNYGIDTQLVQNKLTKILNDIVGGGFFLRTGFLHASCGMTAAFYANTLVDILPNLGNIDYRTLEDRFNHEFEPYITNYEGLYGQKITTFTGKVDQCFYAAWKKIFKMRRDNNEVLPGDPEISENEIKSLCNPENKIIFIPNYQGQGSIENSEDLRMGLGDLKKNKTKYLVIITNENETGQTHWAAIVITKSANIELNFFIFEGMSTNFQGRRARAGNWFACYYNVLKTIGELYEADADMLKKIQAFTLDENKNPSEDIRGRFNQALKCQHCGYALSGKDRSKHFPVPFPCGIVTLPQDYPKYDTYINGRMLLNDDWKHCIYCSECIKNIPFDVKEKGYGSGGHNSKRCLVCTNFQPWEVFEVLKTTDSLNAGCACALLYGEQAMNEYKEMFHLIMREDDFAYLDIHEKVIQAQKKVIFSLQACGSVHALTDPMIGSKLDDERAAYGLMVFDRPTFKQWLREELVAGYEEFVNEEPKILPFFICLCELDTQDTILEQAIAKIINSFPDFKTKVVNKEISKEVLGQQLENRYQKVPKEITVRQVAILKERIKNKLINVFDKIRTGGLHLLQASPNEVVATALAKFKEADAPKQALLEELYQKNKMRCQDILNEVQARLIEHNQKLARLKQAYFSYISKMNSYNYDLTSDEQQAMTANIERENLRNIIAYLENRLIIDNSNDTKQLCQSLLVLSEYGDTSNDSWNTLKTTVKNKFSGKMIDVTKKVAALRISLAEKTARGNRPSEVSEQSMKDKIERLGQDLNPTKQDLDEWYRLTESIELQEKNREKLDRAGRLQGFIHELLGEGVESLISNFKKLQEGLKAFTKQMDNLKA